MKGAWADDKGDSDESQEDVGGLTIPKREANGQQFQFKVPAPRPSMLGRPFRISRGC